MKKRRTTEQDNIRLESALLARDLDIADLSEQLEHTQKKLEQARRIIRLLFASRASSRKS